MAQLSAVLLEGDPAPNGDDFLTFGTPAVNDLGDVAFVGSTVGASGDTGVFKFEALTGTVTTIALAGDLIPATGGTIFTFRDVVSIDDAGRVTFNALLVGGSAFRGIFRGTGGALESIALANDVAPGTGAATYLFIDDHATNAGGELVFGSSLSAGTTSAGLFHHDAGVTTALLVEGDPAPGVPGESFVAFGSPAISGDGSIAFLGLVTPTGTDTDAGIFKITDGVVSLVALAGDPAPGTGSPLDFFDDINLRDPSINDDGDVAFRSSFGPIGAAATEGIFTEVGGVLDADTLAGDTAPGPFVLPFNRFAARPLISPLGNVVVDFIPGVGNTRLGLVLRSAGGDQALVFNGQSAPDTAQQIFTIGAPAMNAAETVVFQADLATGPVSEGLFSVPEPSGITPIAVSCLLLANARRRRARATAVRA